MTQRKEVREALAAAAAGRLPATLGFLPLARNFLDPVGRMDGAASDRTFGVVWRAVCEILCHLIRIDI